MDLPLKSYLPEDYIEEVDMRLSVYQRITSLTTVEEVDDLEKELIDRFGPLPTEAENLLYVVRIKALGYRAGLESILTNVDVVTLRLFAGLQFNRQKLMSYYKYGIKIGTTQLIMGLKRAGKDWQKVLIDILKTSAL